MTIYLLNMSVYLAFSPKLDIAAPCSGNGACTAEAWASNLMGAEQSVSGVCRKPAAVGFPVLFQLTNPRAF